MLEEDKELLLSMLLKKLRSYLVPKHSPKSHFEWKMMETFPRNFGVDVSRLFARGALI